MRYVGLPEVKKLSRCIQRCLISEIAANAAEYFDAKLADSLAGFTDSHCVERIDDAFEWNIITANEKDDLKVIYSLACCYVDGDDHVNAEDEDFAVASLRTWRIASQLPLERDLPSREEQLQYVVMVIASRLEHRQGPPAKRAPRAEPDLVGDSDEWLPVVSM